MAMWLGKDTELIQGAADQAFKPSGAPAPLGADPTQDCLNTCNDRYQKDLDNPSVDYMEAQRRYTDCKASCRDVGAIPTEMAAGGPPMAAAAPPAVPPKVGLIPDEPPEEPLPPSPPLDPIKPGGGCEGGYKRERPYNRGEACPEGMETRWFAGDAYCCPEDAPITEGCKGGYKRNRPHQEGKCPEGYEKKLIKGDSWCCPIEVIDDDDGDGVGVCEGGYILSSDPIAGGAGSIWTDENIKAEHGWYRNPKTQGHRIWHKDWGFQMLEDVYAYLKGTATLTKSTAGACKKGFEQRDIGGEAWCCPTEGDGDGAPGLGEYGLPDWLKKLRDMLMGRGEMLLDPSQYGYSKEAMEAMFGRGFEKVRGAEAATRESLQDVLSRSGMLGTAAETSKMAETGWETERGIADLQRDLLVKSEEQRKRDLLSYTGLAQDIFGGTGIGSEAFQEMVNVGRRGERKDWYQMLLDFFRGL